MRSSDRILGTLALGLCGLAAALPSVSRASAGETPAGGFTTRLGTFTPQPWTTLSGWSQESHTEALSVFRQTCNSLQRRETWRDTCLAAKAVTAAPGAARAFFEQAFVPYLVTPRDQDTEGLMTGYFEPVLDGSPVRRPPFVVPVHGAPADLLYLDARRWQGVARRGGSATIVDDQVVPAPHASAAIAGHGTSGSTSPTGNLVVDPAVFESEPLDRRHRVRRDGDRIVPYWTRQEIEAGLAGGMRTIAWVDDAQALYLMQVQGSGTIRMPDGKRIRVSYADQNGHPFRPRRAAAPSRTRSLPGTPGADAGVATMPVSPRALEIVGATVRHRSIGPSPANDEEVSRIVDALLAQPAGNRSERTTRSRSHAAAAPGVSPGGDDRVGMNLGYLVAARQNDPSYVFFQAAPADGGGPVGALGVPLTATRSIAVDPRSTPLGAPVFIEAERADSAEPLRRLMIAQDTGGAIRGALRADFFWGTGPQAGAQALRTKDSLSMWVLLPRTFVPPRGPSIRTRGIGGGAASAECVVPDPEYCIE